MFIEKDCLYHIKVHDYSRSYCYFMDMYFRSLFVDETGSLVLNFSDSLNEDAFFVNLFLNELDVYISPYYPPEEVIRPRYK